MSDCSHSRYGEHADKKSDSNFPHDANCESTALAVEPVEWKNSSMKTTRHLIHPRDEIMQTMDRIYRYRMTTTSGGNLSIRDESGDIWISPARVDKGNLTRNDIVCVQRGRNRRGTASAVLGVSVSQSDLRGTTRHSGDRSCAPRRTGGVQHLSPNAQTRDCFIKRIRSAARSGLLPTLARAANSWAATSPRRLRAVRQRHSGKPRCGRRWRIACRRPFSGSKRLSSPARR